MTETITTPEVGTDTKTIPPWHVILINDDAHSYSYVIAMLAAVFGFPSTKGMQHAEEVDATGRTILITTSREHAELKQLQVFNFGSDPLVPHCAGSMTCVIEPA